MPTYSLFWDRHYKKIGNCCMTQPLDEPILDTKNKEARTVFDERYYQMIDVGWMNEEKLKWIGWDKQGYFAWITPRGMIYLFKDLKRNERGEEWEKDEEKGTMHLPDDGRIQSYWPPAKDFYEWECEMQENCGFCIDKRPDPPPPDGDKDRDGAGPDVPALDDFTGGAAGYTKAEDTGDVTGTGDATYSDDVTDTGDTAYTAAPYEYHGGGDSYTPPIDEYAPGSGSPEEGGGGKEDPEAKEYIPPVVKENPVVNTTPVKEKPNVLKPAKSPFQKNAEERKKLFKENAAAEFKWDGATKPHNPASVGTYGVVPTVNTRGPENKFPLSYKVPSIPKIVDQRPTSKNENKDTKECIYFGQKVSDEFIRKVKIIAKRIEVNVNFLMTIMAFESGRTFSPSKKNPGSSATGLIQFLRKTAIGLGTTVEELANMSAEEQLDYVEKFFTPYKGKLNTLEDAYMAVLIPKAVGKDLDYVVFEVGSEEYRVNKGLDTNKDGKITKKEISEVVWKVYREGEEMKKC